MSTKTCRKQRKSWASRRSRIIIHKKRRWATGRKLQTHRRIASNSNLRPAVGRQPGSPRDKTRREGLACSLLQPVRFQNICSNKASSKHCFQDTPSMCQKRRETSTTVIHHALLKFASGFEIKPVSFWKPGKPLRRAQTQFNLRFSTYKNTCFGNTMLTPQMA